MTGSDPRERTYARLAFEVLDERPTVIEDSSRLGWVWTRLATASVHIRSFSF